MILDRLENVSRYANLHTAFNTAFDFLKSNDLRKMEPGRYELDGKNLFVLIEDRQGKTKEEAQLEAHKRYIDIQFCISGCEIMGYINRDKCKNMKEAYSEERDIVFFSDIPETYVTVSAGSFAIFFPEDAHALLISENIVKKAVVKILI